MKRSLQMAFLAVVLAGSLQAAEPSTLSDCSLSGWNLARMPSRHSLRLEQMPNGSCAVRLTILPQDKQISEGWRAEIKDPLFPPVGSEVRYSFRSYIPHETLNNTDAGFVVTQWHDSKNEGVPTQRPPLSHRVNKGQFLIALWNQEIWDRQGVDGEGLILFQMPVPADRWVQFEYKVRWSPASDGYVEGWIDGKHLISYHGPIGYPDDHTAPYLKMGIYTVHRFRGPLSVLHRDFFRELL
jgi:hypothetical protein